MGREVRRVPKNWQHPKDEDGEFVPLFREDMPLWPEREATHFMMYENTSEGTPISPAFATPEELARWLANTKASAFADQGASYKAWLRVCQGGYAPSAVAINGAMTSGVEGLTNG